MDSIDDAAEARADGYADPTSTTQREMVRDLVDEGYPESSAEAFSQLLLSEEDVDVPERTGRRLTTREDVERSVQELPEAANVSDARRQTVAREAARSAGAPPQSALENARREVIRSAEVEARGTPVSDGGEGLEQRLVLQSNPDVDPLGQREILEVEGGRSPDELIGPGGELQERVEPVGRDRGTYVLEDSSGNRFPIAEVDL